MRLKQIGTIPIWELDVTCKNCNATFTLEGEDDMYAEYHPTMKGIQVDYGPKTFHCDCRACGEKIDVDSESIREHIKSKVKTRV